MTFSEFEQLVTGLEVPQPDRLVVTATDESVSSAVKGNRPYEVRVACENRDAFAGVDVPDPNGLVLGPGCEKFARPLETREPTCVADKDSDELSSVDVP
jgi:hypothetical protein